MTHPFPPGLSHGYTILRTDPQSFACFLCLLLDLSLATKDVSKDGHSSARYCRPGSWFCPYFPLNTDTVEWAVPALPIKVKSSQGNTAVPPWESSVLLETP